MIKNSLLFRVLFLLAIITTYISCFKKERSLNPTDSIFDTSMINRAVLDKDSIYLKNYIYFLNSPHLSSQEYYYLLGDFTDATKFSFGMIDINDNYWLSISQFEKEIKKQNTCTILELFSISNLFFKDSLFEKAQDFQKWYKEKYNSKKLLNEEEKMEILKKLNTY